MNAKKGKTKYSEVKSVLKDPSETVLSLKELLLANEFKTAEYRTKFVYEPKMREIYILPFYPDRIVHHAIAQVLRPIWEPMFIYDCYSAIPGKGLHTGHYRLQKFLKDKEHTKYCLKFDISKFYPSINHNILFEIIKRKIKCKNTLNILEDVIYSPGGGKNAPIGNYLSQYFSNLYLNEFDHWLKEELKIKYYVRYCDDGVILHSDKSYLKELKDNIEDFLNTKLLLNLNPKTRITPVDVQGVDFLGYKSFRGYCLLRKSSARKFKAKIHYIENNHERMDDLSIVSSVMSYYGWLKHCNSYNLQHKYLFNNSKLTSIVNNSCDNIGIKNPLTGMIV
jgi:retron-type reverse transcriptase